MAPFIPMEEGVEDIQPPKLNVVDQKMRDLVLARKESLELPLTKNLSKENNLEQEMITPYVIVNKTDLQIVVRRLFKKSPNEEQRLQELVLGHLENDLIE